MHNHVIKYKRLIPSLLLISFLSIIASLWATTSHAQVIRDFQKVSALAGGLSESGVDLDTRDDFGESLDTIGDLDGDGIIDLVVGAQRDDDGGEDRGAVYVLFMNTDGTVNRSQKISDTAGGFTGVLDNGDTFGIGATGLGDIDGDGVLDIAVGAGRDDDGGTNRGAVYILFLNTDGTVKNHQKISHTVGGFTGSTSFLGQDLEMLGDFDGDGVGDLYVSSTSGQFWLFFLNADGTVKQNLVITQSNSGGFGQTGALIGDLDGDGVMDISSGAQFDDDGGENRGAVWIFFMNSDGSVKSRSKISDTTGGFTGLLENNDMFGQSVSPVGDLNRDGIPDLVVGAEGADSPDGLEQSTGEVWILFLNRDGSVQSQQLIASDSENFTTVRRNSNLGQAVTFLGDLNGDGIGDIAAAADGDIDGAGVMTGAFYVFFLEGANPPSNPLFQQATSNGNLLVMEAENFSSNTAQGGNSWAFSSNGAASGSAAMEAIPDIGSLIATGYTTTSPRLDYDVNFVTTGTHYVWVRGFSTDGTDNSVHIGLDGIDLTSSRRIDDFTPNTWDWTNQIIDSGGNLQVATINVTSAGNHTLNAWMREDGFRFDKFFVTTDPNFVPSGFGPNESPQSGGNNEPNISNPGDQVNFSDDAVNLQIQATDPDAGDALSYSAINLPTGLSINSNTGLITGNTNTNGTFNTIITVSDDSNFTDSASFTWTVSGINQAPVLTNIANQAVVVGNILTIPVTATDSDGPAPLILQAIDLPFGSSFTNLGNGSGQFNWTPQLSDLDNSPYSVTFRAIDDGGNGLVTSQTILIVVNPPGGSGNRFLQSDNAGNLWLKQRTSQLMFLKVDIIGRHPMLAQPPLARPCKRLQTMAPTMALTMLLTVRV